MSSKPLLTDGEKNRLLEVEKELKEINDKQTKGVMLRSKARWTELGEKNTKYFMGLEKRNYKNRCITKLIKHNNIQIDKPKDILDEGKYFYRKLYSPV